VSDPLRVEGPASSFRIVATLGATGLVSGLILVGAYLATAPRIERNRAEALLAAAARVLPGSTRLEAWTIEGGAPRRWDGPEGSVPKGEAVFAGYDAEGRRVGFAIPDAGSGFMDTIALIYGFDPSRGVVVGMEILDSRETPGLGDKIAFDAHFLANFAALEVAPRIVAVKKGRKSRPNEVDCITGATISSEAVVGILNRSASRWMPRLTAMTQEKADGR
jgi:electron transport complex protein RnfG